jgi:hypothetical protein
MGTGHPDLEIAILRQHWHQQAGAGADQRRAVPLEHYGLRSSADETLVMQGREAPGTQIAHQLGDRWRGRRVVSHTQGLPQPGRRDHGHAPGNHAVQIPCDRDQASQLAR